ncbi:MAG: hypothetical protein JKY42_06800 [Flavobacteriales bacterium]|nr:hypothetical protein [Flavobacteriales bacterium]
MKKVIALFFIVQLSSFGFCQTMTDAYAAENIVWFGADFSKTKLIGEGFNDPDKIIGDYFSKWNYRTIEYISSRYDGKLGGKNLIIDITTSIARSEAVKVEDIISFNTLEKTLEIAETQGIVNLCNSPRNPTGIGVILISDYFEGRSNKAMYSVVYFNIENKKILQVDKYVGQGSGFGLLPFWDKPLFYAVEKLQYKFKADFTSYRFEQRKIQRQQKKAAKLNSK